METSGPSGEVGPKSAAGSYNTGDAEELAMLDVHILCAMRDAGLIGEARLPRDPVRRRSDQGSSRQD
jgi:hypothetical protein